MAKILKIDIKILLHCIKRAHSLKPVGGGVVVKKMNLKIQSIKINTYNCVLSVYVNVTHLFVCSHVGVPQRFCFFG